ncbi:MAG: aminotransferase class IV [Bacteroidia bacterium]|nr:aminotransferase class IV [Bacteroidia bacterium]
MSSNNPKSVVLLNREFATASSITQTLDNRAFRFGDGVFESIRVIQGRPLFVSHHYKRLTNGLRILGIELPDWFNESLFISQLEQLCYHNKVFFGGKIRYQVYRSGSGVYAPMQDEATFYADIAPFDLETYDLNAIQKLAVYEGIKLHFSAISTIKTCNSLPYILATKYARQQGYHNALLMSHSGNLAEASNANLFVVQGGNLFTPPASEGVLLGVMRQQILTIANALGIPTHETPISLNMVNHAQEVFTTNVITGLQPIRFIKGLETTFSVNGEILTRLFQALLGQIQ